MALPPTDRFSVAAAHRQTQADDHQRAESDKILADIDEAIGQLPAPTAGRRSADEP